MKGLRAGPGGRISGVQIQHRDTGAEESIDADLVVDATGRGSSLPRWLSALGCGDTQEEIVKVHVGYASRVYRLPEGRAGETLGMFIVGRPPGDKRLGVIAPIEGGRAICTLGGLVRDYPPEDPAGYLEFARSLAVDDLYRVLSAAEPLSDVISYRFGSQQRRRYERTEHFPDGIVALGDSVCSFNPIYGQGMTTAALSALALDEALREQKTSGPSLTGFSRRFQTALAKIHDGPWLMACGEDFRYPEVEGQRPLGYPALRWYTSRVHEAATRDPVVTVEFLKVMHMLEPITALMQPRMLRHVLWASLFA